MLFNPKNGQQLGIVFGLSFQLVVSVGIGLYAGYYFDNKYEIQPLGCLAGATLGLIAGIIPLLRIHNKWTTNDF